MSPDPFFTDPAQEDDGRELAAMTIVTRAILNLHETITRN